MYRVPIFTILQFFLRADFTELWKLTILHRQILKWTTFHSKSQKITRVDRKKWENSRQDRHRDRPAEKVGSSRPWPLPPSPWPVRGKPRNQGSPRVTKGPRFPGAKKTIKSDISNVYLYILCILYSWDHYFRQAENLMYICISPQGLVEACLKRI